MRKGIIYKISLRDKFIIGSTLHQEKREYMHNYDLKNNRHCNQYLQNIFNKDKTQKLKFEVLQINIPENILRQVEDIWIGAKCSKIKDKKNGLNVVNGTCVDYTPEMLISKSIKQKQIMNSLTLEQRKERTDKMRITKSFKLKEIGDNISKGKKGKNTGWKNNQCFPVLQKTLDNKVINLYSSAYQAELLEGFNSSHITRVCRKDKGFKTHRGYDWVIATKEDIKNYESFKR